MNRIEKLKKRIQEAKEQLRLIEKSYLKESKKEIYLVNETKQIIGEEDSIMKNETIYVFTDREQAIEKARGLNKLYGKSCIFSDEGDFEAVDYDECYTNDLHYFEVVPMNINK